MKIFYIAFILKFLLLSQNVIANFDSPCQTMKIDYFREKYDSYNLAIKSVNLTFKQINISCLNNRIFDGLNRSNKSIVFFEGNIKLTDVSGIKFQTLKPGLHFYIFITNLLIYKINFEPLIPLNYQIYIEELYLTQTRIYPLGLKNLFIKNVYIYNLNTKNLVKYSLKIQITNLILLNSELDLNETILNLFTGLKSILIRNSSLYSLDYYILENFPDLKLISLELLNFEQFLKTSFLVEKYFSK